MHNLISDNLDLSICQKNEICNAGPFMLANMLRHPTRGVVLYLVY